MRTPYRDPRTRPAAPPAASAGPLEATLAIVAAVALLRFVLAIVHGEPLLGDPALAALIAVTIAGVVARSRRAADRGRRRS